MTKNKAWQNIFWWLPGPVLDPWTEGKPYFLAAGFGLNDGWASKNALKGLQKVFLRKKVRILASETPN